MSDQDAEGDDFEIDPDDEIIDGEFDDDVDLPSFLTQGDRDVMFGIAFCNFIVTKFANDFGNDALVDLMFAIDRNMGWSSEIIASRNEIDDIMFQKHGAFDHHLWFKVQDTKAWAKMHRQLYKMTRRYLAAAVDEVVQRELQDTP